MDEDPSKKVDEGLLNRLNALKTSTVSLQHNDPFASTPVAQAPAVDLAERFKKLSFGRPFVNVDNDNAVTPEHLANDDTSPPASPTLDELLADLAVDEDHYKLNPNELTEAEELLAEARRTLPTDGDEVTHSQSDQRLKAEATGLAGSRSGGSNGGEVEEKDHDEDAEADAFLQKILDEVALEKDQDESSKNLQQPSPSEESGAAQDIGYPASQPSQDADDSQLLFPSAPTHLPPPISPLGELNLPSAPKAAPGAQTKKKPKFTDAEIEFWCIICLADATVRCLGCAGDLYCNMCWREGHTGPDAGFEERQHKATILNKKTPGLN